MLDNTARTVSPTELNSVVEFDSPFTVLSDSKVTRADDFAPTVWGEEHADPTIIDRGWEFVSGGYTAQFGYNGPEMHPSESLGGELARAILAHPGTYALVPVAYDCTDDCVEYSDGDEFTCPNSPHIESWVVLRKMH